MTPADKIRESANSIGLACNLAHSLIHEYCRDIQAAMNDGAYATNDSLSATQLQKVAKDLDYFGNRLIWLSMAVKKQRFDLVQASKHLEAAE